MVNPGYQEHPDWFKNSFLDMREDLAEATGQGRRLLLYFYQDGCPYCKKLLEENFSQRAIVEQTRRYFDVIALNIWGDREVVDFSGDARSEKQFATDLEVMFTPTLLLLNEQGEVVLRLNGYYPPQRFAAVIDYVGQHREKSQSFPDYWAARTPVRSSGKLYQDATYLQPPYRLAARTDSRPLLVLFEQQDCAQCDELHNDILRRGPSIALLRQFDVLLLDTWSATPLQTPAGEQVTAAAWARQLGIQYLPSLVMFDANGKEVFRTEAYLRAFHIQSALDYVSSGAYLSQPNFQRYIQTRADALRAQGIHVDVMD
jgi:thioredoxin-related protein